MNLHIQPLTARLWSELTKLFEIGGDSRWCYCSFWRTRGQAAGRDEVESNKQRLRRLTEDRPNGIAPGLLALEEGRPVGWVSVGPRDDYPRLEHSRVLAPVDEQPVWSIVCFVVAKPERGRGISRQLLRAAVDYARENGAEIVEAYPVDTNGRRVPGSYAYLGTRKLYEEAGFNVVATRQAASNTQPRWIMRLELSP